MVTFMVGAQMWVWCRSHGSWRVPEQLDAAMDHFRRLHGIPSSVPAWMAS